MPISKQMLVGGTMVACLAMSGQGLSKDLSARDLVSQCRLPLGSGYLYCAGYLAGALEMHRGTRQRHPQAAVICSPPLNADARRRTLMDWVKANPGFEKLTPSDLVTQAFSAKYPCG